MLYIRSRFTDNTLMPTTKTETLMVRLRPALKEALKKAAEKDHRSISNLVELLITNHCDAEGIQINQGTRTRSSKK